MADIELVIKIPERIHYGIEKGITVNGSQASQILIDAVKNGTPLPKGHWNDIRDNRVKDELNRTKNELEPTNKNDLGVDCINRVELLKAMDTWDKFGNAPNEGLIPLRTPALQDRYVPYVHYYDMVNCVKGMSSVTPQLSSELEKNSQKLEKNFGELDCISRADAIKAMQDKAKELKNEDIINGLCGAVAILYEMPSATPQESKWIPVSERLPQLKEQVLCCEKDKVFIGCMVFEYDGVPVFSTLRCDYYYVIAWMPLPKPYKEVEK